jgi:hypothetical protein
MTNWNDFLRANMQGIIACGTGALIVSQSILEGLFCSLMWGTMMFIIEGFKSINK